MQDSPGIDFGPVADHRPGPSGAGVLVVCEHASKRIPAALGTLGLAPDLLDSHIAWDPGALGVAEALATAVGAGLVTGGVSRLVYDCNRPPEAPDAVPIRSEIHDIPGNTGLTAPERQARVDGVYLPFRDTVARAVSAAGTDLRALVTVHSFTPVYHGRPRQVELGLLHGADAGLTRAMFAARPSDLPYRTELNQPYSAADGVAHTLDLHGAANGLPSVMIEIRNDLIGTEAEQAEMAGHLAGWILRSLDAARKGAA